MAIVMHDNNTRPLVEPDGAGGHRSVVTVAVGAALTLAASAARTESGNGTPVTGTGKYRRIVVMLDVTALATEVDDTLDVYVDVLAPDGATWLNAIHFTQVLGNGAAAKLFAVLDASNPGTSVVAATADAAASAVRPALFGTSMRERHVIVDAGADNASFTYSVTALAQE